MSAPQFTPGPWSMDGFSLVVGPDPKDRQFRVIADCRFNARANARLIAAAPKLYDQLERLAARVIEYVNEEAVDDEEEQFLDCDAELRKFAKEARALLSEVRGGA